ncbi:MAG: hypothetical protein P4N59_13630 [Negativicutes bacterium]|nr:hypothetical protein [Negativicutes bacterium]
MMIGATLTVAFFVIAAGNTAHGTDYPTNSVSPDDPSTFTVGRLQVKASARTLFVSIEGKSVFEFPARVAVDVDGSPDNDLFEPAFRKEAGRCVWTVRSSNWEKKEYALSAEGSAVVLRVKVQGRGKLGKLRYFPENPKTGKQLGYEVSRYLIPAATLGGAQMPPQWRNTMESASVGLSYMTPSLLAFPFTGAFPGSCAVGLAPRPGAYNIDHFNCEFASFHDGLFSTDFLGYTEVNGEYELPALTFTEGSDEFAALAAHSEWLYQFRGCRRINRSSIPRWWLGPIFCGWGEQAAYLNPANPGDAASQEDYNTMSGRLDKFGLKPSIIIIDDKWQGEYGVMLPNPVKWPDLRAFVDAEHARGRRVLLWLMSWNDEGLSSEECVMKHTTPCGADPTSPVYRSRIKETMRRLLSAEPGCFNCDGFKIDFANVMPLGSNLETHEHGIYGIELLKRLMTLFYETAKAVKPDCLINNSCAHPYFSEVTDQCRLHDFDGQLRLIWEVREFRARLYRIAFPGISIDTDDEGSTSREQTLNYLRRAPELGVPDLYHLHGVNNCPLTDDDFRGVAKIWDDYSRKLDK